jgi:NitT/TauT family transport system permease protein
MMSTDVLVHRLLAVRDPGITVLAGFAIWEGASRLGLVASYLLPAPSAIGWRLLEARGSLFEHMIVTLYEILLSFIGAVVVGIVLALLVVYFKRFERAVYPLLVLTQAIPKVALAPLFVVWLGFGLLPKIAIGVLIAFFPVLVDMVIGFRSVELESIFLLRSMGASRRKIFWYLQLPNALPNMFGAMKVAVTLATVGAIVAEFIGANEGLGYVLVFANGLQDTPLLFAALAIISVLAIGLYILVAALERVFIRWHVSVRSESALVTM